MDRSVFYFAWANDVKNRINDGELGTERTWTDISDIIKVPTKWRRKDFSQHFTKIARKTAGLLSFSCSYMKKKKKKKQA